MDKNCIIYEPDSFISDNTILSSLCLYYDEVILFTNEDTDILNEQSELLNSNYYTSDTTKEDFIKGPLKILSQNNIITTYTNDETAAVFPLTSSIELDVTLNDNCKNKIVIKKNHNANNLTENIMNSIIDRLKYGERVKISELIRLINVYSVSEVYKIPLFSTNRRLKVQGIICNEIEKILSDNLAILTICNFSLPKFSTTNPEDIIIAKEALKDELLEFRAGILDLTYLLYQRINNDNYTLQQVIDESYRIINTKIRSSIMSLELKIKNNNKHRIRNMLINGTRLVLSGANLILTSNSIQKFLTNSDPFLNSFSSSYIEDKPEHKIASYILDVKNKLNN